MFDLATSFGILRLAEARLGKVFREKWHLEGLLGPWAVSLGQLSAVALASMCLVACAPIIGADWDEYETRGDLMASCTGDEGAGMDCGAGSNDDCCASPLVPGGTFNRSQDGANDPSTVAPATVSTLRLDAYEVTVGRFRAFVEAAAWPQAWKNALKCGAPYYTWTDSPAGNEKRAINCVNWFEASDFCAWDGGRLPTEAEWNYAAAAGGEQREYPWGFGIAADKAIYSASAASQVGSKPAGTGEWGQFDLAGNLWEWVEDAYAGYVAPCTNCVNRIGSYRVIRGGGFYSNASTLRSGLRYFNDPSGYYDNVGLRCARTR